MSHTRPDIPRLPSEQPAWQIILRRVLVAGPFAMLIGAALGNIHPGPPVPDHFVTAPTLDAPTSAPAVTGPPAPEAAPRSSTTPRRHHSEPATTAPRRIQPPPQGAVVATPSPPVPQPQPTPAPARPTTLTTRPPATSRPASTTPDHTSAGPTSTLGRTP